MRGSALIDHSLLNSSVGIDAPIAQEWPMGTMFIHPFPFNIGSYDFFTINRALRKNFAAWRADETLPPEFNPVTSGRRFVTDPIRRRNEAAIRNGVAAHHRLPCRKLRSTEYRFFSTMPANGGGIKQDLSAPKGGQARRFGIPLIPANADAKVSPLRFPAVEAEVARGEIEFLIVTGIIRNVHFAILTKNLSARIDDHGGVVVDAGGAFLEKRSDNYDGVFARDLAESFRRRSRYGLGQREIVVIFALTEVVGAE